MWDKCKLLLCSVHLDITVIVDWALKTFNLISVSLCSLALDITVIVDWSLKLIIYFTV